MLEGENAKIFSHKAGWFMAKEKTVSVLIADDDNAQVEMLGEYLRRFGYSQIMHAGSIRDLWSKLDNQDFDILLLDYRLPDGTGLDVLKRMKDKGINIPVVMVTGQGNERVAVQAIQHGAADYLLKSGDYLLTLPSLIQKTIQTHQLEQSIQRSLSQIHYQALLLNNVHDAIVVWDLGGLITYWNPAATTLFGWNETQRLGQQISEVYLNFFTPNVTLPDADHNAPYHVRKYHGPDGKILWVSSRVSRLFHSPDTDAKLLGYMDVSHDITDRVLAEEALRNSEARYRAIVEDYQTELICRFTPNGNLTFVNEVFCKYFGFGREKLLGMNLLYFVPDNERQRMVQHWTGFSPEKPTATLEHQVQLPGRGLRWLQRTDRAIFDDHGRIFEFQSVGRDITDHKRMEQQIQTAQAHLVQAARLTTIGEIASGIAHQIYNPLTTIIADAQILMRNLSPNTPGRESAEAIEQAGWRLQKVVQRLLSFSEPSANTFETLAVNETIAQALTLVMDQITHAGIQIQLQLAQDLPTIRGNVRQLENLWVNLLLLARDASVNYQGQWIRIVTLALPENAVMVEIHDEGKSISQEQLATIFEPDFIGSPTGRGTGMELSICREIVRQHGGQITADSSPDHDTIFRVVLPAEV